MKKALYFIVCTLILNSCVRAQMTTRVVAENLFIPWEMIYGPDDHIWFTQKNGFICRLEPKSGHIDTLYHETATKIIKEGGMLGMALHPDFKNNPYVYVAHNYDQSGSYMERIMRYTYNGSVLTNPTIIFDNIQGANYHNGCRLCIANNHLFITTGDATTGSNAQDITKINGKILRLNLDGTIPNDNPISGSPIWSWGHRNAQGLIYANSKLYSSEHGPMNDDEFNIIQKGRNYGWPNVEGFCNTPSEITFCNDSNVVEPLHAWTPTIAVSGIEYYNHPMFPNLQGSILMNTLKDSHLYQLKLNSSYDQVASTKIISQVNYGRLRAICVDPDGRIYISTSNSDASGTATFIDKIIEVYDPTYSHVAAILKEKGEAIAIYPNPAENEINIYANVTLGTKDMVYTMTNAAGQKVLAGVLQSGNNKVSITALAKGIYQVVVTREGERLSVQKILK